MLKKLLAFFGGSLAVQQAAQSASPAEEALLRQIAERSKSDPLIGAKLGGKDVTQRLLAGMKTAQGVHIESLLCALGALAGYACQASVRAQAVARGLPETALLTSVQTKDGQTYFFGDDLNKPLAESRYSVWGIAGGGAQEAGCKSLPDLAAIFRHTSEVVGTDAFGKPRVPDNHVPRDQPINYVRTLWPVLKPVVVKYCPNPEHWPVLLGLSIQEVILMAKTVIDPCLAMQLVMEAAVPMSKVNLAMVR
ncbi:hypothetical protein D0T24_13615 [Duganella sp. BJB480]|uniref:hypothetical protein n=1 Tax=unclassified Duganella TaxID=2636909 RepID=UPI000EC0BA33|nr:MULTISPECIES: hypothetical protein [unclassified Duganella]RFP34636.1 hypothetical protein D0T24_13615 [Duganella sp. BJB480]